MDITIEFPGGDRVDAVMDGVRLVTEQDGSAASPFQLFLASIGTCAGIYVLGFCRQRGLPTDDIRLTQRLRVDPATGMVAGIDIDIQVPPGFPEKYHAALVRSAEQCAVKKHMEAPPRFSVRTVTTG